MTSPALHTLLDQPVVPVLRLDAGPGAIEAARALVRGGLRVLEVTLRTPTALLAIEQIHTEVPDAVVAAGTVLDGTQARAAAAAGAAMFFSPGHSEDLSAAAASLQRPLIPGVSTATEVMAARSRGHRLLKFFPAHVQGGPPAIRALTGPFPDLLFCPTGGVRADTMGEYLTLPAVACVGGSWLAPQEAVAQGSFEVIEAAARAAIEVARAAGWTPRVFPAGLG